ncbi:MAG: RodZ domain-containing protein [Pseudomonadota bacterium]
MDETAATPPAAAPRSIGERLRAGRERAGLSIAASAEKLHLDVKVIEALEGDRFAELGASVYVRGHLRRYADFVGEPGAEMVSSYTAREARPPPPDLTQVPHAERRTDPRRLVTPMVGLACAAVLMLAIWWVLVGSRAGKTVATATPPVAAAPADNSPPLVGAGANLSPVGHAPVVSGAGAMPAANTVPAASDSANSQAKRDEAAAVRETRLKLELSNDSWVEVYDARGERLFYDVASAGSVQSVSGRGPLRVVLGNASAVTVEVDGKAREIPAAAADGEGARFVVNRSGSLTRAR